MCISSFADSSPRAAEIVRRPPLPSTTDSPGNTREAVEKVRIECLLIEAMDNDERFTKVTKDEKERVRALTKKRAKDKIRVKGIKLTYEDLDSINGNP